MLSVQAFVVDVMWVRVNGRSSMDMCMYIWCSLWEFSKHVDLHLRMKLKKIDNLVISVQH